MADLFIDLPAPHPKLPGVSGRVGSRRTAVVVGVLGVLALGGVGGRRREQWQLRTRRVAERSFGCRRCPHQPADHDGHVDVADQSDQHVHHRGPNSTAVAGPKYLSELDPVDDSRYGDIRSGSATANGVFYGRSVIFYNHCYNNEEGDIWVEYNLSRASTKFTTTIGVSDDDPASASGTYRILVDGIEVRSGQISSGVSVPVELDVTNALHIRLQITSKSAATRSCAQGVPEVHTIWGDARVS